MMRAPAAAAAAFAGVCLCLLGASSGAAVGTSRWNAPSLDSLPAFDLLDLGGKWTVHATAGPGASNCSAKVAASVPGDIYSDLLAAGTIGDPLGAFGDWKTAWAGRTSWTYSRSFAVTPAQLAASGAALLIFEGLETNATVRVNGELVLSADDSWLTYTVSAHEHLAAGTNTIEVAFTSVYDACEFSDPFHSNVTCPGRVYVRQAASESCCSCLYPGERQLQGRDGSRGPAVVHGAGGRGQEPLRGRRFIVCVRCVYMCVLWVSEQLSRSVKLAADVQPLCAQAAGAGTGPSASPRRASGGRSTLRSSPRPLQPWAVVSICCITPSTFPQDTRVVKTVDSSTVR